jgi:hypothetical protein
MTTLQSAIRKPSLIAWLLCAILACVIRLQYHKNNSINGYNATTWDALGYYMYLPGALIYHDVTELQWMNEIEKKYHVTGGYFYQAIRLQQPGQFNETHGALPEPGEKYVFKYLGGVALMQTPFFLIGHFIANATDAPTDGFSWPYQYSLIWGAILWLCLGLYILRKVLLFYFSEWTASITLLLLFLATNLVQYSAVEGSMSHVYIFPLYAALLWYTIQWHENPKAKHAFWIGLLIGLSVITRPTELVMIFIPILWKAKSHAAFRDKWKQVWMYKNHLFWILAGGLLGVFPQLVYWKYATGSWIFDVGSKWFFLNPWWRVLIGFEKGWFIYTPITILMVIGFFFLKNRPFKTAVITFCLLNIWIIISWHEWGYGASYSCRALVQSYPVFALALAALIEVWIRTRTKWIFGFLAVYLMSVNLFQVWQYNAGIIHYSQMNGAYYRAVYLDANPTPLDYSLLDTDELFDNDQLEQKNIEKISKQSLQLNNERLMLKTIYPQGFSGIESTLRLTTTRGILTGYLNLDAYQNGEVIKLKSFRFGLPFIHDKEPEVFQNHFFTPPNSDSIEIYIYTFDTLGIDELSLETTLIKTKV